MTTTDRAEDTMDDKKQLMRELLIVAAGEVLFAGLMLLVYFLLHLLDRKVILAAAIGVCLVTLNFFLMILGVISASNKAEKGDVAGGKRAMSISMMLRLLLMIAVLAAAVLSGLFELKAIIAMLIPLLLFRPIVSLGEFFRKAGEKTE